MRIHATLRWTAVTAFVLAAAGPATAQSAGGTGGGSAPANTVPFEGKQDMSPREMIAKAQSVIARMDQVSATIGRQLEQARAARNVVKALFLNDKKSQIDVATRMAKERFARLQAILAPYLQGPGAYLDLKGDDHLEADQKAKTAPLVLGQNIGGTTVSPAVYAEAVSLLSQLENLGAQASSILAEAQTVVGSDVSSTGATEVSLTIDIEGLPSSDTATVYDPTTGVTTIVTVQPPPPVSGTGG